MIFSIKSNRSLPPLNKERRLFEDVAFQVIFSIKLNRSLPPLNEERRLFEDVGWHITDTENHWSSLATCKEFVEKILDPYKIKQVDILELNKDTIDCWSVHTSEASNNWLKATHSQIKVIYVSANCTSIFQPVDIILKRPFKYGFRQQYD